MSFNKVTTIMLLGAGNHVALPVIRALGDVIPDHISIFTLSTDNEDLQFPQFSRHINGHYLLHAENDEELLQELLKHIRKSGNTILVPLNEYYVRKLVLLKEQLKNYAFLPPLPSLESFDALVNKYQLNQMLEKLHFPNAVSHPLHNGSLEQINSGFFPCLLKPVRGSSGRGIQKVRSQQELMEVMNKIDINNYIIQEIIPGEDIDCSFFAIEGEIKAITIQKGLESKGFSFSTAIEFIDHPEILEIVKKLTEITNYSGLAHLDFRLDERDEKAKLIDFNARFWLSLLGSKAAGVNFAYLYCKAAMGIPFAKPEYNKIHYMMGMSAFKHHYKSVFGLNGTSNINSHISTDLPGRLMDPLPELARLFNSN